MELLIAQSMTALGWRGPVGIGQYRGNRHPPVTIVLAWFLNSHRRNRRETKRPAPGRKPSFRIVWNIGRLFYRDSFPQATVAVIKSFDGSVQRRRLLYFGTMTATDTDLRIALFQPDIPGNTGTILRMAACLGLTVDIIEPAGFDLSDRALKRAGMDYVEQASLRRHLNWQAFQDWLASEDRRVILASTKASNIYTKFRFRTGDILLFGRESSGVPDHVHDITDDRILVPMVEGRRSLNVAMSAAMIAGEAIRQIRLAS